MSMRGIVITGGAGFIGSHICEEIYNKFPTQTELHTKLFKIAPKGVHNSWNDILICLRNYYKLKYNEDLYEVSSSFKRSYKCCI